MSEGDLLPANSSRFRPLRPPCKPAAASGRPVVDRLRLYSSFFCGHFTLLSPQSSHEMLNWDDCGRPT